MFCHALKVGFPPYGSKNSIPRLTLLLLILSQTAMATRTHLTTERSAFVGVESCNICLKEEASEPSNKYPNSKPDEHPAGELDS